MKITLPLPPSANDNYSHGKNGPYLSAKSVAYRTEAALRLNLLGLTPIEGDVSLTVYVYRSRKNQDIGNVGKILEDVLQGYCYHNDVQIAETHYYRRYDRKQPRVEIECTPTIIFDWVSAKDNPQADFDWSISE